MYLAHRLCREALKIPLGVAATSQTPFALASLRASKLQFSCYRCSSNRWSYSSHLRRLMIERHWLPMRHLLLAFDAIELQS